jgi:hypothetical protein
LSSEGWLPVQYRDFYDVPRLVAVEHQGRVYLFDSPFDDDLDEYVDHYTIYRLPESAGTEVKLKDASWEGLVSAGEEIGRISVTDVEFDETRRERLHASVFRRLGVQ